jgi:putative Holliday junction resolvase
MKEGLPEQLDGMALAFDYGLKRIGVAVGQAVTRTANPCAVLSAQEGIPRWEEIQALIDEWHPQVLVVGIPLNMDGTEQPFTARAKKFANRLEGRFGLPVYGADERQTTVEARAQLFEEGGYKALSKSSVDAQAAKIMLEAWLRAIPKGSL